MISDDEGLPTLTEFGNRSFSSPAHGPPNTYASFAWELVSQGGKSWRLHLKSSL